MKKFICEVCGKEHDGSFGSGRFCSKSCASVLGARKKNSLYPPKKLPPKIEVRVCQKCGKEFEVDLRKDDKRHPKRFCSSHCSHSRVHSEENRQKISNKLKETAHNYSGLTKAEYAKKHNYETVIFGSDIQLPVWVCKVCGRAFYHRYQRETCSSKCRVQLNKERQREHLKTFPKTRYKINGEWTADAYETIYKFYYTYKITNLIDGHYYLGIHMTNDLNDGYMGSGVRIKRAIKKYGIENFSKSYLQFFKCYKDLVTAEFELITQEILEDPNCYNLSEGGVGGPNFKGKTHTEKTKLKICEQRKLQQERNYIKLKEFYAYYLLNGWACAKQTFEYKSSFRAFKERLKRNHFINSYKDLKYIP